jgi:hypothetical protein
LGLLRTLQPKLDSTVAVVFDSHRIENYNEKVGKKLVLGLALFTFLSFLLPIFAITLYLLRYGLLIGGNSLSNHLIVKGFYAFTFFPLFHHFPKLKKIITAQFTSEMMVQRKSQLFPKVASLFGFGTKKRKQANLASTLQV